jgi:hypothetical protein
LKSYTAGYVLSKHLAALKRQCNQSLEAKSLKYKWEKAYELSFPLLSRKQQKIAGASHKNLLINTAIALNEWFLPGDHNHLLCRKYFIRKWIQSYIEHQKIDHLVILGAGLDPLVYTLDEYPAKISFVDHPDMIGYSEHLYQNLLAQEKFNSSTTFFHGIDLNDSVETTNFFANIAKDSSNLLFITEGLIDYLLPGSAINLLKQIDKYVQVGNNHWIGTLFCLTEMPRFESWVFLKAVESVGESIKWKYSKNNFLAYLSTSTQNKMRLYNHNELNLEACINIRMNMNTMNGFYLFTC